MTNLRQLKHFKHFKLTGGIIVVGSGCWVCFGQAHVLDAYFFAIAVFVFSTFITSIVEAHAFLAVAVILALYASVIGIAGPAVTISVGFTFDTRLLVQAFAGSPTIGVREANETLVASRVTFRLTGWAIGIGCTLQSTSF